MQKFISITALLMLTFLGIILMLQNNQTISGYASKDQVIITIQLEPEYANTKIGGTILLGITLIKLGSHEIEDVTITLFIKDETGKKERISSETAALQTRTSLVTNLRIPENIKSNSFEIAVEATDTNTGELLGTATQRILLTKSLRIKFAQNWQIPVTVAGIVLLFLIISLIAFNHKKIPTKKEKEHLFK